MRDGIYWAIRSDKQSLIPKVVLHDHRLTIIFLLSELLYIKVLLRSNIHVSHCPARDGLFSFWCRVWLLILGLRSILPVSSVTNHCCCSCANVQLGLLNQVRHRVRERCWNHHLRNLRTTVVSNATLVLRMGTNWDPSIATGKTLHG